MFTRPEPGAIPDKPGWYQVLDAEGRVIHVAQRKSPRAGPSDCRRGVPPPPDATHSLQ